MPDSYVYIIFRSDGRPCYVGKGRGERWRRHDRHKQNPHLGAIFAKADGKLPVVKIKECLTNEEAVALEILLIDTIGREHNGGPLVNLTDGGEGTVGAVMSGEWRANRSKKAKELWQDPAHRQAMSELRRGNQHKKGKPNSKLWHKLTSERMRGNTHTLGMRHSEESKNKLKQRWQDPEWKAAMMEKRRAAGMYTPEWASERYSRRAR